MLPKSNRIPRKMFPLLRGSKTFQNDLFLLKFAFGESGGRFCFSVSKKIAKDAVTRNKMRRSGYRLIKKLMPKIKPKIIAAFSFKKVPQNDDEIYEKLESIIKVSNITK